MGRHRAASDGNLLPSSRAVADRWVLQVCDVAHQLREVGWKKMAVEIDVHNCRWLTLRSSYSSGSSLVSAQTGTQVGGRSMAA
jgi:hypothetical protein